MARGALSIATEVLVAFFSNSWSAHRGAMVPLRAPVPAVFRLVTSSSIQSGRVGDKRGGRSRELPVFSGGGQGRLFFWGARILGSAAHRGSPVAIEVFATFFSNSWSVRRGARTLLGALAPATSSSIQSGRVGDKRDGRSRALRVFSGSGSVGWIILGARTWLLTVDWFPPPIARFLVAGPSLVASVPVAGSRVLLAKSAMATSGVRDEVIPLSGSHFMLWAHCLYGSFGRWYVGFFLSERLLFAEISLLVFFFPKFQLSMISGHGDLLCCRYATLGRVGTTCAVGYRRWPCINLCTGSLITIRDGLWQRRRPGPFCIWIRRALSSGIFDVGSDNFLDGSGSGSATSTSEWRKEELILTVSSPDSPHEYRLLRSPA